MEGEGLGEGVREGLSEDTGGKARFTTHMYSHTKDGKTGRKYTETLMMILAQWG